jgi:hypothetical protein
VLFLAQRQRGAVAAALGQKLPRKLRLAVGSRLQLGMYFVLFFFLIFSG